MSIPPGKRRIDAPNQIRRASLLGVPFSLLGANAALADTAFANFRFRATGAPSSRTMPDRLSDVVNVLDWGADPTFGNDSTTAIRNAFAFMFRTYPTGSGTVYFPPGRYKVTSRIDIQGPTAWPGKICGAGRDSSVIEGTFGDVIINVDAAHHGVSQISDLTIRNNSAVIGSGALRFSGVTYNIINVSLVGMTCLDINYNCFNTTAIGLTTESPAYDGSIGITGNPNLFGWRANGPHELAYCAGGGGNGTIVGGCSIEQCGIGFFLGLIYGTGTQCTISGNVLTLGGLINPFDPGGIGLAFLPGDKIVATGVPPTADVRIVSLLSGTGGPGSTYSLNGASGISLTTPQMMTSRRAAGTSCMSIIGCNTEGCQIGAYLDNCGGCHIGPMTITGTISQGRSAAGSNTTSPQAGVVIRSATTTTFDSVAVTAKCTQAAFQFVRPATMLSNTFINCFGNNTASAVTDANAFIDDGSGNGTPSGVAGNVLTVKAGLTNTIGIGGAVLGSGVPTGATTPTIDSQVGFPSGSFQANNGGGPNTRYVLNLHGGSPLNLSPRVFTINHGLAWGLSSVDRTLNNVDCKAALQFINCIDVPPLNLAFALLPGQPSADPGIHVSDGMQFDIVDGQKSGGGTAMFADTVAGGGSQKIRVRYMTGVGWTRCG
jgi:Pectate lyase superfamily protein